MEDEAALVERHDIAVGHRGGRGAARHTVDQTKLAEDPAGTDLFEDAPTTTIPRTELLGGVNLVEALVRTGLAGSKMKASVLIKQGGAYVNNVRQTDVGRTFTAEDLLHDRYLVLRKGRKEVHIIKAT